MNLDTAITERELTEEELTELQQAIDDGLKVLPEEPDLLALVEAIEAVVTSKRGTLAAQERQSLAFSLGAVFAMCAQQSLQWELVFVRWSESLSAMAVVPMDRSLAILPLEAVDQALESDHPPSLSQSLKRLIAGELPKGGETNRFAVLLP